MIHAKSSGTNTIASSGRKYQCEFDHLSAAAPVRSRRIDFPRGEGAIVECWGHLVQLLCRQSAVSCCCGFTIYPRRARILCPEMRMVSEESALLRRHRATDLLELGSFRVDEVFFIRNSSEHRTNSSRQCLSTVWVHTDLVQVCPMIRVRRKGTRGRQHPS